MRSRQLVAVALFGIVPVERGNEKQCMALVITITVAPLRSKMHGAVSGFSRSSVGVFTEQCRGKLISYDRHVSYYLSARLAQEANEVKFDGRPPLKKCTEQCRGRSHEPD
jgi:hypothetical protein